MQTTSLNQNLSLYDANSDNVPENDFIAMSKQLGTKLIYSYKINPQSLVYIGYSDNAVDTEHLSSLTKTEKTILLSLVIYGNTKQRKGI